MRLLPYTLLCFWAHGAEQWRIDSCKFVCMVDSTSTTARAARLQQYPSAWFSLPAQQPAHGTVCVRHVHCASLLWLGTCDTEQVFPQQHHVLKVPQWHSVLYDKCTLLFRHLICIWLPKVRRKRCLRAPRREKTKARALGGKFLLQAFLALVRQRPNNTAERRHCCMFTRWALSGTSRWCFWREARVAAQQRTSLQLQQSHLMLKAG